MSGAQSLSFASHSLGARLVLEAAEGLKPKTRVMCLTAGAINDDCLTAEYSAAAKKSIATSTLASRKDMVLQMAFPVGDVIADILHADHAFGESALGTGGPERPIGPAITPFQILNGDYGHTDYFPPGGSDPLPAFGPWVAVAKFIVQTFRGQRRDWPQPG